MSISSRVNAFLERAKVLTDLAPVEPVAPPPASPPRTPAKQPEVIQNSPKLPAPSPRSFRKVSPPRLPRFTYRKSPPPKLALDEQKVRGTSQDTPRGSTRGVSTPRMPQVDLLHQVGNYGNTSLPPFKKFEACLSQGNRSLEKVLAQLETEHKRTSRLAPDFSQRTAQLLSVVKEEAMRMDSTLAALLDENQTLKQRVPPNPSTKLQSFVDCWAASGCADTAVSQVSAAHTDAELAQLFNDQEPTIIIQNLCFSIREEQALRLSTEEETSRVLALKEREIAALEEKLQQALTSSQSTAQLMHPPEGSEEFSIQRLTKSILASRPQE